MSQSSTVAILPPGLSQLFDEFSSYSVNIAISQKYKTEPNTNKMNENNLNRLLFSRCKISIAIAREKSLNPRWKKTTNSEKEK